MLTLKVYCVQGARGYLLFTTILWHELHFLHFTIEKIKAWGEGVQWCAWIYTVGPRVPPRSAWLKTQLSSVMSSSSWAGWLLLRALGFPTWQRGYLLRGPLFCPGPDLPTFSAPCPPLKQPVGPVGDTCPKLGPLDPSCWGVGSSPLNCVGEWPERDCRQARWWSVPKERRMKLMCREK